MPNPRAIALLALSLLPFTWLAIRFSDLPQFGKYGDEGLYLIAAKSLHDSGEYRISSLPGQLYQVPIEALRVLEEQHIGYRRATDGEGRRPPVPPAG